jgi:hypothetical protein
VLVPGGLACVLLAAAAGCTATHQATPSPGVPTFAPSTSAASSTTARPLPTDCQDLLPAGLLDAVLGKPLVGRIHSVTGVAEPNIGRVARLLCQFGLPDPPLPDPTLPGAPAPPPGPVPLEIGISTYTDTARAQARLADTVQSERALGAAPTQVTLGGQPGLLLVRAGQWLLAASSSVYTLTITVAPGVLDDARVPAVLADLGGRVLAAIGE